MKIEISPKGEEKSFANPTPRGDCHEWLGASLSGSVSLLLSLSLSLSLSHTSRFIYIYVDFTYMQSYRWDPGCRWLVYMHPTYKPWSLPCHQVETLQPLSQLHSIHSSVWTRTDGSHPLSMKVTVVSDHLLFQPVLWWVSLKWHLWKMVQGL